jgi:hypothetical protein
MSQSVAVAEVELAEAVAEAEAEEAVAKAFLACVLVSVDEEAHPHAT